jgi:hypothetical protein
MAGFLLLLSTMPYNTVVVSVAWQVVSMTLEQ